MIFEKASSINSIVDAITKVSDQTNLLSVNATSEFSQAATALRESIMALRKVIGGDITV